MLTTLLTTLALAASVGPVHKVPTHQSAAQSARPGNPAVASAKAPTMMTAQHRVEAMRAVNAAALKPYLRP